MNDDIRRHCAQIDQCNQRGGRMLSIVDLIGAGTISADLAAYSLAAIGGGASFMVGASPGGAGKTTVMGALLNFVPPSVRLIPADGAAAPAATDNDRSCYICHEIGDGRYYAYLWGQELRAYFDLPAAGHMLATNLHADTYEQARDQICIDNDVSAPALRRMNLMYFLAVRRSGLGTRRWIEHVWESDGRSEHRRIFDANSSPQLTESTLVSAETLIQARRQIKQLLATSAKTIEQIRSELLRIQSTP